MEDDQIQLRATGLSTVYWQHSKCQLLQVTGVIAFFLTLSGCGSSEAISVSGTVTLDGLPAVSELVFEPITDAGKRRGQSVTVFADSAGAFDAMVPTDDAGSSEVLCRVVVTVPRGAQGMSSAFDYTSLPDKVVGLRRTLQDGDSLNLLLTQ